LHAVEVALLLVASSVDLVTDSAAKSTLAAIPLPPSRTSSNVAEGRSTLAWDDVLVSRWSVLGCRFA